MYDITSAKSLERLDTWHTELDKYDSEEGMVSTYVLNCTHVLHCTHMLHALHTCLLNLVLIQMVTIMIMMIVTI